MRHLQKIGWTLTAVTLLIAAGCAPEAGETPAPAADPAPPAAKAAAAATVASATLAPRAEGTAAGTVTFTQADGAVQIEASVTGAAPGDHGFHIHAKGDCSAADFTSAGGHFSPNDNPHGGPDDEVRHAGDLGNITIGEDGSGQLSLSSDLITLAEEGPNSVLGKAVILHEGTDDLVSQPTGAAGGRLACGVIELEGGDGE